MSRPDLGDISTKLSVPGKKSVFEKQKAEAEAKRLKEEAETAAVYEDFVKSFDNDEDDDAFGSSSGAFSKRHFPPSGPPGRGGLGNGRSGPGSLGPAPAFSRKRPYEQEPPSRDRLSYKDPPRHDARSAFRDDEDEQEDSARSRAAEKAKAKPTLQLSSLPSGTSVAVVKAIIPSNLSVDGVKFLSNTFGERKSTTAIVTMAEGTASTDLDTAVSALQGKYLGWGFYLSLSRHLSSAVATSNLPTGPASTSMPFGAKAAPSSQYSLSRAPPPGQRGFAPPASYGPGTQRLGGPLQVNVKPPTDLKQLKLIHKTVESIITHGPEFEALLMSRAEVQKDEKWAWIWDSRSEGGVYYRWRLWDILTNAQRRMKIGTGKSDGPIQALFESGPGWSAPDVKLPFEYITSFEEVVSNSDYDSSEDEDSGDEGRKRLERLQGGPESGAPTDADIPAYLNPMHKAKLIYLLSRLPTTTARLRRGDVARITSFAISHAGAGANEVVSLLTLNIHQPFSHLAAVNTAKPQDEMDIDSLEDREKEKEDPSSAKLMGLYLISDILSSSSTSGVRHAWRYRALFESSLRSYNTFAHLGRLEKELSWGKLKAEKWKRSVMVLLSLWEGWSVFPLKAQEEFVGVFNNPPLTAEERIAAEREDRERMEREKGKSKWKAVSNAEKVEEKKKKVDGDGDVDGEAMVEEEEDLDGEPMVDDDLDGEPMMDDDIDGDPMEEDNTGSVAAAAPEEEPVAREATPQEDPQPTPTAAELRRRRPKAEDMFAE